MARFVPGTTQLLIFGAVMLGAAVFMLRGRQSGVESAATISSPPLVSALKVVPAGLLVGTLTGIVGVGGGFLIVPVLMLMRMSMRQAVGTSLLVITGTCVVGFLGYLSHVQLNWTAVAFVASGTLPGVMLGAYLHQFVPQAALRRGFAAFLVVMAVFIFVENLGPLSALPLGPVSGTLPVCVSIIDGRLTSRAAAAGAPHVVNWTSDLTGETRMHRVVDSRCVLAVRDLKASTQFYTEVLGFTRDFGDGSDGWSFLSRDSFKVMLGECPDEKPASELGNHSYVAYLTVEGVDDLHREIAARGPPSSQLLKANPGA
jgi:hypothetical protein